MCVAEPAAQKPISSPNCSALNLEVLITVCWAGCLVEMNIICLRPWCCSLTVQHHSKSSQTEKANQYSGELCTKAQILDTITLLWYHLYF